MRDAWYVLRTRECASVSCTADAKALGFHNFCETAGVLYLQALR